MAHIQLCIKNFGSEAEQAELAEYINDSYLYHAYVSEGLVIIPKLRVNEMQTFLNIFARDPKLNWIEYTFQFDL